jgi:hypothetical protein
MRGRPRRVPSRHAVGWPGHGGTRSFSPAGYDGELRTLPITSEDERIFVLAQDDVLALSDIRTLEQVLQQVLGRKVWILDSIDEDTVPFA